MLLLTKNPFIILIAYLICFSATNVVFNFKLSQNLNGIKTISNNLSLKINREAILLSLAGGVSLICTHLDRVLIFNQVDAKNLAIYANGMMIGMTVNSLFKTVLASANAKLPFIKVSKWHVITLLILGTTIGILCAYLVPHLIVILYGEKFAPSSFFAKIVLVSLGLFLVSNLIYDETIFSKRRPIKPACHDFVVISGNIYFIFNLLFLF